MISPDSYTVSEYLEHFSAQNDVLTRTQQLRLRSSTVHVAGLGGVGFHVAMFLSEIGVGSISGNDPQRLEIDNLNRIPFASVRSVGTPKTRLLAQQIRERPHTRIALVECRSEDPTAQQLQSAADLLICCSNTYSSRLATAVTAIQAGKPLLDIGVCDARRGFVVGIRLFEPRKSDAACPICTAPNPRTETKDDRILGPVAGVAAGVAAHLAMRLLVGRTVATNDSNFIQVNLGTLSITRMRVLRNPRCPACSR